MRNACIAAICCLGTGFISLSQEIHSDCGDMSYENRNQVDYGPLQLSVLRGTVKDPQSVVVPKVCIGVFTEKDHKLIASVQTNDKGYFELKNIPGGDYRLVATFAGFSPANAKIRLKGRSTITKELIVQMRLFGVDTNSFVELK